MFLFSFCPAACRGSGRGREGGEKRAKEGAVDAAATYRPTPHSSPCSPTTNNPSVFSLPIYKQSVIGSGPAYRGAALVSYQCAIGSSGYNTFFLLTFQIVDGCLSDVPPSSLLG